MPVSPVPVPAEALTTFVVAVVSLRDGDDAPDDPLPEPPPSLLLARGATPALVDALEERPARLPVVGRSAPGRPALEEAARVLAFARRLAEERDGVVLDLVVPRVVTPEALAGRASSHWFVFEHEEGAVPETTVRTHGLVRFGLPELVCEVADAATVAMHDAVLVGVAQRLLEEWPERDPVGPATITLRDVARGYGDASAGGDDPTLERSVDVTLSYDEAAEVVVVVLHDDPATALFS